MDGFIDLINGEISLHTVLLIFFFFQAEDGIRDLTVTGVQTCALPISTVLGRKTYEVSLRMGAKFDSRTRNLVCSRHARPADAPSGVEFVNDAIGPLRSEERRVGKECRSRWSPYH